MLECRERDFAIAEVTIVIAVVVEPCREFSQVALSDRRKAHGTKGMWLGLAAIHQDKSHVLPSNVGATRRSRRLRLPSNKEQA